MFNMKRYTSYPTLETRPSPHLGKVPYGYESLYSPAHAAIGLQSAGFIWRARHMAGMLEVVEHIWGEVLTASIRARRKHLDYQDEQTYLEEIMDQTSLERQMARSHGGCEKEKKIGACGW